LSDRYSARHITKRLTPRVRRARSRKLVRASVTLTIAGLLVGGAGAAIHLHSAPPAGPGASTTYALGSLTTDNLDRDAERAGRGAGRETAAPRTGGKVVSSGRCDASFYDEPQETASGEAFDPAALTAAHRTLPFDTRVRVTNLATGTAVVVRINDRGPSVDGRCLDLSAAAFKKIANATSGVLHVKFEVLAG
jgi:rare lipoprotein A